MDIDIKLKSTLGVSTLVVGVLALVFTILAIVFVILNSSKTEQEECFCPEDTRTCPVDFQNSSVVIDGQVTINKEKKGLISTQEVGDFAMMRLDSNEGGTIRSKISSVSANTISYEITRKSKIAKTCNFIINADLNSYTPLRCCILNNGSGWGVVYGREGSSPWWAWTANPYPHSLEHTKQLPGNAVFVTEIIIKDNLPFFAYAENTANGNIFIFKGNDEFGSSFTLKNLKNQTVNENSANKITIASINDEIGVCFSRRAIDSATNETDVAVMATRDNFENFNEIIIGNDKYLFPSVVVARGSSEIYVAAINITKSPNVCNVFKSKSFFTSFGVVSSIDLLLPNFGNIATAVIASFDYDDNVNIFIQYDELAPLDLQRNQLFSSVDNFSNADTASVTGLTSVEVSSNMHFIFCSFLIENILTKRIYISSLGSIKSQNVSLKSDSKVDITTGVQGVFITRPIVFDGKNYNWFPSTVKLNEYQTLISNYGLFSDETTISSGSISVEVIGNTVSREAKFTRSSLKN